MRPDGADTILGATEGRGAIGSAPVSKTGGCRFESCRPCCTFPAKPPLPLPPLATDRRFGTENFELVQAAPLRCLGSAFWDDAQSCGPGTCVAPVVPASTRVAA